MLGAPANCRRLFDLRLAGWTRAVEVLAPTEAERVMSLQLNPFTAATAERPIAVVVAGRTGGEGPVLMAWPASLKVTLLTAAVDYGPERYVLDECGIEDLFSDNILI